MNPGQNLSILPIAMKIQNMRSSLKNILTYTPCSSNLDFREKRYSNLRKTLIFRMAPLALAPVFILIIASYFWLQNMFMEDFRQHLAWDIENAKNSIEYFVDVKISALRFLASGHDYEQLSDQQVLANIFTEFKREFGAVVDLGLIDQNGIQQSYTGPYNLQGKDYANQEWFHKAVTRGIYVSDVFMGYRRLPHFAIAVKKDEPDKETFWILRATIDMETLNRLLSSIKLGKGDDAFIINQKGTLQTPSQSFGNVLEQYPLPAILRQRGTTIMDIEEKNGHPYVFGYSFIKDSPWILSAVVKSGTHAKIASFFRVEYLAVLAVIVGLIFIVAFRMVHVMVNWIRECDQKREEALREAEHAAKLASVGRLAAGVSHEINNPLAIINEKAGLIKDILTLSDNNLDKDKFLISVNGILNSVKRARTITHQLLGFARRMDVTPELLNLNDIVREVLGFLEKETLFRDVQIKQNLKKELPRIKSNRSRLQQVFLNIVNNAIDALNSEGIVEISTNIKDANTVRIIFKDNGHGIDADTLKHIFDPFFTTKGKDKGTGLGLFISYGIIKKLGGNILVESEVEQGTTFTIELPINKNVGIVC
jgi:two-component system NtrC family sensor kinase